MDKYDAIIIGAGIGGLTAGNILAKNGMKVLILEKNHAPGGAVTTYYRNGYPIDISHAICALNEGACLRKMFEYIGIFNKLELLKLDKTFILLTENKNKPIFCYADLEKYTEELKSFFPNEVENVKHLFNEMMLIWNQEVTKTYYNPSLPLLLLYPILFPRLFRYRNYTFEQLLSKFIKSPQLKEVLSVGWPYLGMEKESLSALYMACFFGAYHQDGSYFIKGGFGKLVDALAHNFKDLGGEILFNTEVMEILVDNKKRACGVKDKQGSVYSGKIIVSNADSKKTFLKLLNKDSVPKKFLIKINEMIMTRSAVQVHIFAEAEVDKEFLSSGSIVLGYYVDLENKLRLALKSNEQSHKKRVILLSIHPMENFIPNSPRNNYVFNVGYFPADYHLWKNFFVSFGKEEYEEVKNEICKIVTDELCKVFAIKKVKYTNVLTPLSLESWLGATEGAIYDLAITPGQSLLRRLKHKTPVKNLYLVGTKTFPGHGITGAFFSAFEFGDIILKGKLTRGRAVL